MKTAEEVCTPFSLAGLGWWHIPLPRQRQPIGTHPSKQLGIGDEIAVIRPIEPGDDDSYYSAPHSAIAGEPMEVRFYRNLQTRAVFIIDLAPALTFGEKRNTALQILVSLANSVINQPADGVATLIAAGDSILRKEDIGNSMELRAFVRSLLSLPLRQSRGQILSEAIFEASRVYESLICVISDFIILERDPEWEDIAAACSRCQRANSEVVFVRVLDSLERHFYGSGSLTISAPRGGIWTSAGTGRAVERRNSAIRRNISGIVEEMDTRFCEVVTQDPLPDKLHDFLESRLLSLRQHMPNLPFTR